MMYLCGSMQIEYNLCSLIRGFKWEWTCFLVQTWFRCVWGKECHGVESFYIYPVLSEVHCALNMGLGKHTGFLCCTVKGVCREYRLQIKGSDNTAFFGGQRNAESRLNTLQYVNAMYVGVTFECCRGKPVSASCFGWNIVCCSTAIAQPQLF